MAAELGLLSLTQLQKLAQQQQQQQSKPGMWNWTSRRPLGDDGESWEVRAFAQDMTGGAMGTTWPPRSYTCTFCHREFRSAQALGGHMNVHRRDRARLRQSPQGSEPSSSATSNPTIAFPSPDFVAGNGLCLFYPLPSPGAGFAPAAVNAPSTLLSMSPDQDRALNLLPGMAGSMGEMDGKHGARNHDGSDGMVVDEIDLELRLGRR